MISPSSLSFTAVNSLRRTRYLAFSVLLVAAFGLASSPPSHAAVSTFGSIGQPNNDGEFGSIVAIDTDSAGNVYVLDTEDSGRVKKFSSAGVYISRYNFPTWSCTPNPGNNYNCSRPPGYPSLGSGFSSNQTGFAVVPAGDAFIVRDSLNRVMKFDMSSGYVSGSERSVSNSWGWNPSAGGSNVVLNADGTAFTAVVSEWDQNALSYRFGLVRCPVTNPGTNNSDCTTKSELRSGGWGSGANGVALTGIRSIARVGSKLLLTGERSSNGGMSSGYLIRIIESDLSWDSLVAQSGGQNYAFNSIQWNGAAVAGSNSGAFATSSVWGGSNGIAKFSSSAQQQSTFAGYDYFEPGGFDTCKQVSGGGTRPWQSVLNGWSNVGFADVALADDGTTFAAQQGPNDARIVVIGGDPVAWIQSLYRAYASPFTGERITFTAAKSLAFGNIPSKYEWDLDGNGSFETDTGSASSIETAYSDAGSKTVRVRVSAPRQGGGTGSTTDQLSITVLESRAGIVGGGISAPEGGSNQYYSSPPGNDSPRAGEPVTFSAVGSLACGDNNISWDLDGNGSYETTGGQSVDRTFPSEGSYEVGLRIAHSGGRVDVARGTVNVRKAPRAAQGEPGVSINGGATYTNNPNVSLTIGWPADTDSVRVSNDGGFASAKLFEVAPSLSWELQTSGSERLPKTVYVRFGDTQYTDDIILDRTAPEVSSATASAASMRSLGRAVVAKKKAKSKTLSVSFKAKDNVSGVAAFQVTTSTSKPGSWIKNAAAGGGVINDKTYTLKSKLKGAKAGTKTVFVRVADSAGNASAWKKVKVSSGAKPKKK